MNLFYFTCFGFVWTFGAGESISCKTPNNETASCIPLLKCRVLILTAASNEPTAMKFLQESICDEKASTVCCGSSGTYRRPLALDRSDPNKDFQKLSKDEKKDYVLKKILPTQVVCGLQHTDDYFYDSAETSVDEFPWLVYIIENSSQHDSQYYLRVESNCVGVLISKQYVLSTKVCREYAQWYFSKDSDINMILGLHHIHKKVNCIDTPYGVSDCTDPSTRVSSSMLMMYEDVVLFRLDTSVDFSDFVRPICIPLQTQYIPATGNLIMASGWAEEKFVAGKSVKLKKRMKYTVMDTKECKHGNLQRNPICGIPDENNTQYICTGDVGGPLMYRYQNNNWFVVGLLYQSGINLCDEAQPATAMQLTPDIVNWIIENMEP